MSYFFSVMAANKADAIAKVEAEFAQIVEYQPTHAKDKDAVVAFAKAYVGLFVVEPPAEIEVVYVSMSGSLGWRGEGDGETRTQGSVNVTVSIRSRASS